ncbi:ornithine--oxo-acid transaminase [Neolewinella antarctica]|uniref:ornithine aminotransferase n=1 Tax=Neolewinella antarctica TaxID=442734 RepID=A0ABX0X8H6_9BACT|nr:ornithine--oxo-acid transaminase [Neolewinella antarctica]NJC25553.1 ornithine--oxo-acid transaminase [Neolewinella antarctica]
MNQTIDATATTAAEFIDLEDRHGAHNYHPLPVVLAKGEGCHVWDVDGKHYYDFLSAYSAVNQGHCHPRIVDKMVEQSRKLTLTSRAFHNDQLGVYEKYVTEYFAFDKVLPMNTGAEGVETAIKICRKWGYEKKGIPDNQARIIVCGQNFHGRTVTIISFSSDQGARDNFGPYTPGFESVPYGDIAAMEAAVGNDPATIAGVLVEPIQGEAGVFVPQDGYIEAVAAACKKHNVLFIADEIQTGVARTGALLRICGDCACAGHCERQPATYVRPDILILGKALSGGVYPVSAVFADDEVMNVIQPGQHGSTFGGNPVACAVAMEALEVVRDEHLIQNARTLGARFRAEMQSLVDQYPGLLKLVRGKGLLNALVINDSPDSDTAWNFCLALAEGGLLAKPTHGNIIRFAPPLVITEAQLLEACGIIGGVVKKMAKTR